MSERIATSLIPSVGTGLGVATVSGLGDALAGEAEALELALGRGDSRCSKTGPDDALALGDGVGIGGGDGAPAVGVGSGISNCVGPFGARGTGISDGDGLGLGEALDTEPGLAFGLALSLGEGEGLVTCATVSGACVAHDCESSRSSARLASADDESAAAEAADAGRVCPRASARATNVASHTRARANRINLTGLLER